MQKLIPMMCVADVRAALAFHATLGSTIVQRHPDIGEIEFAFLSNGEEADGAAARATVARRGASALK